MNFRFGLIFLLVALVFAVAQVNSEEAEAGVNKRSPDPLNVKAIVDAIKARLGRSAESMKMDRERRNPDPSILDVITDAVNSAMNSMG
ncbi:uncharacterized protein [Venturia canescens]|uniref:uncharacterized protein n=1 Tax=Venturia canescens TaxID=32260 RepID=UPI001C9C6094|nr:uncharacterized protein LOC122415923 [Venturia canescens]